MKQTGILFEKRHIKGTWVLRGLRFSTLAILSILVAASALAIERPVIGLTALRTFIEKLHVTDFQIPRSPYGRLAGDSTNPDYKTIPPEQREKDRIAPTWWGGTRTIQRPCSTLVGSWLRRF